MFTFTSAFKKFTILGKSTGEGLEYIVNFQPIGAVGQFTTDNEELAEKLRKHPDFNKKFTEIGLGLKVKSNIVEGTRSSSTHPEIGKEAIDPQEYIEFGKLQAKLLKNDGTFRKDASEEDKNKYNQLKEKLGE